MSLPTWAQKLRPGSYKGVPFLTHGRKVRKGQRTIVDSFPLRDDPQIEQLGALPQRFGFEMFLVGDDYMPGRDALEAALDAPGIGRLVDPWAGDVDVYLEGEYEVEETTRMGGYVSFRVSFVRGSTQTYPTQIVDTQQTSQDAATTAATEAQTQFSDSFSLVAAVGFVVQSAEDQLNSFTSELNSIADTITMSADGAATFVHDVTNFESAISSLILAPGQLAQNVNDLINQLVFSSQNPEAAYQALKLLWPFSPAPAGPTNTPSRAMEETNRQAIQQLVQRSSTFAAAGLTASIDYASYNDAITARDELQAQFDALASDVTDPDLSNALLDCQSATIQDITARGLLLPQLTNITLNEALPATVLAWRLYQDASQGEAICNRNQLNDPLFLPGGVPLEVLTQVTS